MEKKNILIVEDRTDHLVAIKQALFSKLGGHLNLFPTSIGDVDLSFNNNNFLIGKITEGDYKGAFEFHKDINLYIIDVYLVGDSLKSGLEFAKFILKNRFDNFKIIIISNNKIKDDVFQNENVIFFSKFDRGIHNFPNDLVKIVRNVFQIVNTSSTPDSQVNSLPIQPIDETFRYRCHVAWDYFRDNSNRLIDKFIFLAFYILISITTIYAIWNILVSIRHSFLSIHKELHGQIDETLILKTSEHIFLYLLPIFIIFGFFNYYKTNTRITILDGKIESNDDENSTKAMNLTKILFISSIISYVIIKVIEMVFFNEDTETNVPMLIASGVLLLLLMVYFVFLDKKKHDHTR